MIRTIVSGELGGEILERFEPQGFSCHITTDSSVFQA